MPRRRVVKARLRCTRAFRACQAAPGPDSELFVLAVLGRGNLISGPILPSWPGSLAAPSLSFGIRRSGHAGIPWQVPLSEPGRPGPQHRQTGKNHDQDIVGSATRARLASGPAGQWSGPVTLTGTVSVTFAVTVTRTPGGP